MEGGQSQLVPANSDRRIHIRFPCELRDQNKQLIRNISMGGLHFESAAEFNLGKKVTLPVGIPPSATPLSFEGTIVHKSNGQRRKYSYGVSFAGLNDATRAAVHQYFVGSNNNGLTATSTKDFEYRSPRYGQDLLGMLKIQVLCRNEKQAEPIAARLLNVSRHGAFIEFVGHPKDFLSQIQNLQILVEGEEIFLGAAKVSHIQKKPNVTQLGLIFRLGALDTDKLFMARDARVFEAAIQGHAELVQQFSIVDTRFKALVADCRTVLESLKTRILDEEKQIGWIVDPAVRHRLLETRLAIIDSHFRSPVHSLLMQLDQIVEEASEDQRMAYKSYYFHNLSPLIQDAPYAKRAYEKPLGYPGDYRLMLYIYDDVQAGQTLWEKTMSSFICSFPAAQAVRNRVNYLCNKIGGTFKSRSKDIKILSLACGPCREVRYFLENPPLSMKTGDLYFVDQDREALRYASTALRTLNAKLKRPHGLHFFDHTIKDFLTKPEVVSLYPKFDLIYSAGVYDYMDDGTCRLVTGRLYEMLRPGGLLVIGNFSPDNPYKYCQEFSVNWHLNLRTRKQLMDFIPDTIPASNVTVEQEDTGINLFLNVRKK